MTLTLYDLILSNLPYFDQHMVENTPKLFFCMELFFLCNLIPPSSIFRIIYITGMIIFHYHTSSRVKLAAAIQPQFSLKLI